MPIVNELVMNQKINRAGLIDRSERPFNINIFIKKISLRKINCKNVHPTQKVKNKIEENSFTLIQ